ncbi:MAG: right-handed parallel beta-helix repeat-containing protein, partial [Candidatus Lokiarchaeota archaeon]|nr:right-handed parallel beta-helix repeat-containing protein [Candidatus Lokiarchaeota archaeon]
ENTCKITRLSGQECAPAGWRGFLCWCPHLSNLFVNCHDCSFQGNVNPAGFDYGNVVVFNSSRVTFENCSVINGSHGFRIERSFNLTLRDNCVSGADVRCVYLSQTNDTRIDNNTVEHSGGGGIDLALFCYRNVLISNHCESNMLFGIGINQYSSNNTAVGNVLCFNQEGIEVWSGVADNGFSSNNASFNRGYGAYMWLAFDFSFSNNIVSNNGDHGIFMSGCSNVTVSSNTITGNAGHGVHFWEYFGSYGCRFLWNTMTGNALGCFNDDLSLHTGLGKPNEYEGNGCLPPSTQDPPMDDATAYVIACVVAVVAVCAVLLVLRRSKRDGYWVIRS